MIRLLAATIGLVLATHAARAEMTADDCKALAPHIEPITKTLQPLTRTAAEVAAAGALLSLAQGKHEIDTRAVRRANETLIKASEDIGEQVDVISRSLDDLMTALVHRCRLAD